MSDTKDSPAPEDWKAGARTITLAHTLTVVDKDGQRVKIPAGKEYKASRAELEAEPKMDAAHPANIDAAMARELRSTGVPPDKLRAAIKAISPETRKRLLQ
jgi:hypothetical protein